MSLVTDLPTVRIQGSGPAVVDEGGALLGSVIDERYRITRRIGAGGMGTVYEAEHLRLGTRVAVKVLPAELSRNDKYRRRFVREAKVGRVISNPHVVGVMDFGALDDGRLYFAMDMLVGQDLEEYLHTYGSLRWNELSPIFSQILDAMGAAHARGAIHRDIKPSNCFLCETADGSMRVKVLDFGIAKVSPGGGDGVPMESIQSLTGTGELFGTAAYMAPELVAGSPADARSDIYALGVLLFRALTGGLPFPGINVMQVMKGHVATPVPSLRAHDPEISVALESVVFKAMAKHPEHRYQSTEELGWALQAASRDVAGSMGSGQPLPSRPSQGLGGAGGGAPGARGARPLILVTLALVVVVATAAVLLVVGFSLGRQ